MRPSLVVLVVAAGAACVGANSRAAMTDRGVLQPAGGGVRVASAVGGASTECMFDSSRTLSCSVRRDGVQNGFRASMNHGRVIFRAGSTTLAVVQRPGIPVYGTYRADPRPRTIRLAESASIGFLGTNVSCEAARDGTAPGLRCLAHVGPGLPGPCCGPSFPLLVGSYGIYLSARRLQELLVVASGVTVGSHSGAVPYRVVREWRR